MTAPPTSDLRGRLDASLGATYTVERELGGAGMSRVFVATERALGRQVVVKVLPAELAAGVSVERFRREIQIAAGLVHPHIIPLLSAGEFDGLPYYTMPFVAGESLRARLAREGALAPMEAARLAREIADALDYAHRNGVVHRDVKPENVLLHDGHALVADFGIARALTQAADAATLTQMGLALGTPAYMSPEQALGEQEIDGRADVYSLGCVLWEMLAGHPPYEAATPQALIVKHCSTPVPALPAARAIPHPLGEVVTRAMAKETLNRYASAGEMARALDAGGEQRETSGTPRAGDERPSIAVLPFAWIGPDPSDAWLADGIAEELIADLSRLRGLRVIARGSAMRLKGSNTDAMTAARELGVRHVIEGSVWRAGDALRITARLVDATDGGTLWAEKLAGVAGDIFDMRERLSQATVDALRVAVEPREAHGLAERPIADVRAYECYLRARTEMWTFTEEGYRRAARLLQNALEIVGDNALLLATRGSLLAIQFGAGVAPEPALLDEAERCAARVFALDPDSASGHRLAGFIHHYRGRITDAVAAYERSREREPGNGDLLIQLAYAYVLVGRDDDARAAAAEAVALDPLTPITHCLPGFCLIMAGRAEEAVPHYRKFHVMDATNPAAPMFLAWSLGLAGHTEELSGLADDAESRAPGTPYAAAARCWALAHAGRHEEARRVLTPEVRAVTSQVELIARIIADCCTMAGDLEGALDALEHMVRLGFCNYPYLARHARHLAPLRDHPRFRALLERVRIGWERGSAPPAPSASVPVSAERSLAVLPFANLSGSADDEYFAAGLTEQLIADLSQLRNFRVISRNSTMQLKGANKDLRAISSQLDVRYVVDGAVARSGDAIRITTQVTDALQDRQLWAATHKGTFADVFDLQERISRAVVDALKVKLTHDEDRRLHERPITDVHAYDCYLRAREEIWRCTKESLDRARLLLQNGLDLVGDNALLFATLGEAHWQYINMAITSDEQHLRIAEEYANKALALAPGSAAAEVLAGEVCWKQGAMDKAISHMRAALEQEPTNLEALLVLTYVFAFVGKPAAARPLCARLLAIDPLTPLNHGVVAYVELFDGRFTAALDPARRMYRLDPESPLVRWIYTVVLAWNGRIAESPWNLEWAKRVEPATTLEAICAMLNHALVNDREGAARCLPPNLAAAARWDEQMSWHIGACHALLGDTASALDWLENAFRRGFWNYPFLSQHDPFLANLRSQPAFQELLVRVREQWNRLERESG